MSIRHAAKIAKRELRGGTRGFGILIICLALGIAAITAVGLVRESIARGLEREGAVILGGDAAVTFTYRFADPEERAILDGLARVSEIVDFRSMAVQGDTRALTQVKGVDQAYPLYGEAGLSPDIGLAAALDDYGAVMDQALVDRMGLSVGDAFNLGTQRFTLRAVLTHEPDGAGGGFGLGPRTIVRTSDLANSQLLQPGTLYSTEYRLALGAQQSIVETQLQIEAALDGAGIRWRDRRNGAPGIAEFVERLSAFLVIVGLAGLAVGGVGVAAAVRAHLQSKISTIATLKTLGATRATVFWTYMFQIGALSLLGVLLGLTLGTAIPLLFAPIIEARLPVPAAFGIYPKPLIEAALYGVLAALLFTLWPLAQTESVRPASLFRDVVGRARTLPRLPYLLAVIAALTALVTSAALLSGMAVLTLYAALGLAIAFLVLVALAQGLRHTARWLARKAWVRGRPGLRLALGAIGAPGGETVSVVLSLGLGLTVLAAVGQIDNNLRSAIAQDLPEVAPSYFMVDIQNDQMPAFRERVENDPGVSKIESAPMLRGVITEINGKPAAETAGDHWVLEGDRGITYAPNPPEGTVVTDGTWWPEQYVGPPQISFAAEEALEMGLKLGDEITVNILGRDISAQLTSLREVDFSTAGIGFIMSMNPSALAGAPHTHIATIYAAPDAEATLIRDLARAFPNITAIRVGDAIARVSEILTGIAAAVTWGALAALVTGIVVLIGAAAAGERVRTYEAAILKTLGAQRRTVLRSFALRSALMGAVAACVAVLAGAAGAWAVSTFVMDTAFRFAPLSALIIIGGGFGLTLIIGLIFAMSPLAKRPAGVLRARD